MAYLKPQSLTCPNCGFSAEVMWVIGVGPNSKPGQTPYRRLHRTAPFVQAENDKKILSCPECKARVT